MSSRPDYIEEEITKVEEGTFAMPPDDDPVIFSDNIVNIVRKVVAEFIGTFFVVFAGCGSVAVNKMYGSVTFPGICITWGLIVMVMIYTLGHISGAHFNPAVTITFTILNQFPRKHLFPYLFAQILGAILGSGALYLLLRPKADHFYGTTPIGTSVQSFFIEIIISFLLMFVISGVATDTRAIGELAGVAVGSTILLNVFIAGPISGASMNPARSLGPAIIMHNYKAIWAYIIGPIVGTFLGGLAYNLLKVKERPTGELVNNGSFLKNMPRSN